MKLTNLVRDSFIDRVMSDVPKVDYVSQFETAATKIAADLLPPAVRAIWDDKTTREYVDRVRTDDWGLFAFCVPGCDETAVRTAIASEHARLERLHDQQDEQRSELRKKLKGCAYNARTRKALVEMLPEFEKYLPEDDSAVNRCLPVVQNVVADFVRAGWPAGSAATS